MQSDLKHRPFCGSEKVSPSSFDIQCNDCKATMAGDTADASVRWNRRAALSEKQAAEVAIKPLEWGSFIRGALRANSPIGDYGIFPQRDGSAQWGWLTDDGLDEIGTSLAVEAAKAAAQSDYEQRIRSALVDVPVEPEVDWKAALTLAAQELDRIASVPNVTETKNTYDQFQLAKAYADRGATSAWASLRSPPLSHRGEDSAGVERLAPVDVYRVLKRYHDDGRLSLDYISALSRDIAATRSASATTSKGCADE